MEHRVQLVERATVRAERSKEAALDVAQQVHDARREHRGAWDQPMLAPGARYQQLKNEIAGLKARMRTGR
jgi:hypothetical protein